MNIINCETISALTEAENQQIEALVLRIETTATQTGKSIQKILIRDTEGTQLTVHALDEARLDLVSLETPIVMWLLLRGQKGKGDANTIYYDVQRAAISKNGDISRFQEKPRINRKDVGAEIMDYTKKLRQPLQTITYEMIKRNLDSFKSLPLSTKGAFSANSGILEATWKLVRAVDGVSASFDLDKDLAIAGALLYYIGYVEANDGCTYSADNLLINASTSVLSKLAILLYQMNTNEDIQPMLKEGSEDIKLLEHILAARDGIAPVTREAKVLRDLDQLNIALDCFGA